MVIESTGSGDSKPGYEYATARKKDCRGRPPRYLPLGCSREGCCDPQIL